jgi:hypothetical protein
MSETALRPATPDEQAHVLAVAHILKGAMDGYHQGHPGLSYQIYMVAAAHVIQWLKDEAGDEGVAAAIQQWLHPTP